MTENEAKQWLKHTRAYQHKCDNYEYIDIKGACNEECKDFYDIAIQALEEIQQYRAIGTVEEFKDLKEKAEPKKITYQIDKNRLKHEKCPTCLSFSVFGNYCSWCGQKIDWENEF